MRVSDWFFIEESEKEFRSRMNLSYWSRKSPKIVKDYA